MHLQPNRLIEKIGFNAIREAAAKQARSSIAKDKLNKLMPSSRKEEVEKNLASTREMMNLLQNEAAFPLNNLHDVRDFLKTSSAEGSLLPMDAFLEILELAVTARRVKSFIKDREEDYSELKEVSIGLIPLNNLEEEIRSIITENGELRSDASDALKSIRGRLNRKRNDLRNTINKVMSRAAKEGMASDEGPTIRSGRMVIPIQAEYKRKIQGFVHDVSSTGQTVYLEPVEALNINNEIRQLESEEKREIERILRQLTNHVRADRESIEQNLDVLTSLDIIAAKAQLGINLDCYVPVICDSSKLYLKDASNPILKLKNLGLKKDQREDVIPLDLELNEEEQCLVITGPNAGGKSVAMKTLGLCVMMTQSGFAIPAKDSTELPIYSGLFVDMGDDQSIENDLSTFSSRLEWMRDTLKKADHNSLVLIDEAAAGTDPEEGGALFQALIELLMQRKAKILVTTHHGSLKIFAHDHLNAVNGSMEFDQNTLSPTYRFKKGVPGSSYAFEIAQRMELDDTLLSKARTLLGESKSNMETLISELETKSQEAEELKRKYDNLKEQTEAARHKYDEKRSAIEKEKETIREKALQEAKQIMQSANRKIEEAVEQIVEKGQKDSETIREARKDVEKHKDEVEEQLSELETKRKERKQASKEPPKEGDTVRLEDANTTGELVDVDGNKAVVMAGGLRLKTDYDNLVKVEDASKKKKKQRVTVNIMNRDTSSVVRTRLEVRGMRGPEAMKEVEYYLDNALAAGLNEVQIIHGKGEGILKNMIHEYLEKRKDVQDFHLAPIEQGGAGCTIVKL
ncbi:endonuclease MutS2 [Balneolaceae bacterium YR4-1]|uniref:Endonuclease MutS2 n=1 Tax=Halalkalibaculum roseum TaxID=2709311 RepID=A0A6M1STE1_9BACT|nr:endonuclease MutS2 [Halalkalibaculum roseum]NGP75416.1 endonuclease MutS2 [Halalkalibaculum roseum]